MTSLVRIALSRPYTFVVAAIMVLIVGTLAVLRTPTDIFPNIRVPVVAVAWTYNGLSASEMSGRVLTPYQRTLTTTVNDIEHIEANSLPGIGVVKIYFQPGADVRLANAQITAVSQTLLRQMPTGTTPPLILNYNASTVPIVQLALAGEGLSEQRLFDYGLNVLRTRLVTVPGAALPFPFGGRTRQIQVDIDPQALLSKGLSATDVGAAIAAQTQITPAGFVKIGEFQYSLKLNNAPGTVEELNDLPIRTVNGATVRMSDVAHVRDGSAPQQNVVHVDGQRSVLMTVLKSGATSTISIVDGVRAALPELQASLPKELTITPLNDQSAFVKAAVAGVVHEGALAAILTSLMILLFLGSWRSTTIIAISIPLAVLAAIAALAAFGQTLNVMTLGGLALAVGILVDDATVTIENVNWHLEQGKDVRTAILDGAAQIVTPAFVSLLCICIVFVPMFFLPGVSGFLFVPMALSVVFAMIASFLLSRTLVPTMAMFLLRPHAAHGPEGPAPSSKPLARFQQGFERRFGRVRDGYAGVLGSALGSGRLFVIGFVAFAIVSLALVPFLGRNFFPAVDSGAIALHVRAPVGSRIEESAALFDRIQRQVRMIIPPSEIETVVDNIGLSSSGINTIYNASGTIGSQDGDILIGLKKGHAPTAEHIARLRRELPRLFPTATFSFLPADVTSQILNFGAPSPIDIQVTGNNLVANQAYAQKILRAIRGVDGVADARIQQPTGAPELRFDVDRTRINALGLDERDVTAGLAGSVAGSAQTAPVFWLNPANGVSYPVVAQTPEYMIDSLQKLAAIPVTGSRTPGQGPQVLGGLGVLSRGATPAVVSQYNIQPMVNVFAATQGRDLGGVADDIQKVLKTLEKDKPAAVKVTLRGQYQTMNTAFSGMGWGLLGAVVMIYLLIVINFQSWSDPFVIVSALPAALAGIAWMLFATGTPLSVPALTGAIMCMGVATANSILVVSFARERLAEHGDAVQAAFEAGVTRFRPVLMTALAMIIGMAPMALGLGEGAEQNAPLGRAVVGGLLFATCASLLFVPCIFALVHGRRASRRDAPSQGLAHA
ncbi:efflux RND transporter permease subunit [Caulobacter sp. BE254]|uniref:efflux RND transporter permease subunit n=1 Tax=Caulobacter sp. BE254 TaxID=2817720 RepID=UPI0028636ED4|nr:efflux RND transporter permease subunit [Caulobacter sp. BE254]MDR7116076.1 multidrug efflux pump subunit AcrB [Caulobacter sp. BE254]